MNDKIKRNNTKEKMNFSWIEEEERLMNLKENSKRENLSTIELVSMYINQQNEIETVERETMEIEKKQNQQISKTQLIEWRDQRIKYTPNTKYILKDILYYHVPIEPENIPDIKSDTKSFLHTISLEDITISPAIFIFHSLTTIFFCFHEINNPPENLSKIIQKQKHPKKTVKISLPNTNNQIKKQIRITRKRIETI